MKLKVFALIAALFMFGAAAQSQRLTIVAPDNAVTYPSTAFTVNERDTLVGLFSIVWDDGYRSVWDSIAAFDTYGIDCSVALTTWQILHGDTTNYLDANKVRLLHNRGWTFGSQGYNQHTALFEADTSKLFLGTYTSLDPFEVGMLRAVTAITDTIGLPHPRFWSPPGSGTWAKLLPLVAKYHEFGVVPRNTATSIATNARRQNIVWTTHAVQSFSYADNIYLAGYPGLCPDEYQIPQGIGENYKWGVTGGFREQIFNAVKTKGWVVAIMHRPSTLATATGQSMTTICAFLDSLQTAGKLRVVTVDEGYDLMYRTPVASSANYIWENFDDNDGDNTPDFIYRADSLLVYRDSTYGVATTNYGYGGNGYIKLNWSCPRNYQTHATMPAHFGGTKLSWNARFCEWVVPVPAGGTKEARFECFVQIDTTLHTIAHTESIGVMIVGKHDRLWNRWGGSGNPGPDDMTKAMWAPVTQAYTTPGNFAIFTLTTTGLEYATGGPWLNLVGSWDIPDDVDYLYISIWKDSSLPRGAVKVSCPSLQWIRRDPLDRM